MLKRIRISLLITMVALLSSCAVNATTVESNFKIAIDEAAKSKIANYTNHVAQYYSYYLPLTMGRITSSSTSTLIKSQNYEILMTLDVMNIIHRNTFEKIAELRSVFSLDKDIIAIEGKSLSSLGFEQYYRAQLFQLNNQEYLVVIQTQDALLSSKVDVGAVGNIAYDMLRLARTLKIQRPSILAAYSNAETFNYQKINLNMFTQMAPETGTVLDMIEGDDLNLLSDDLNDQINDSPTEQEILQD